MYYTSAVLKENDACFLQEYDNNEFPKFCIVEI